MDRNSVNWRGYIPAITTPFKEDSSLDLDGASRLLSWMHEQGMHGVNILGTQGEWFSMSKEEKADLLAMAGDLLKGKLTLITGCSAYTAIEVIENISVAASCGFDGVLVTPPPYIMPVENEIFEFYKDVNAASELPICIYNWPPGTNVDMSVELLSQLTELDKVVAIKNSTPDTGRFLNVFFALKDKVRIFGAPTNELGITLVQHHKSDGLMGAGGILGSDHANFFNTLWEGDIETARELGKRDRIYMEDWFNTDYTGKFGSAQAIFKEALNQQGLPGGFPRRPILPLGEEGKQQVRHTLIKLGIIQA
jgi:4-hydroxy-tetrahydrodipicolinate synthase